MLLLGAEGLSASFVSRLVSWVRAGGGLLLFPDASGGPTGFNSLLRDIGLPSAAGMYGSPGSTTAFTTLGRIDFQSPLLRGVFARQPGNAEPRIESPRIVASVRLRADAQSRVVAQTVAGDVFLLEKHVDRGTVLVFAVAPSLTWSDFPLKGLFVPLLHRAVLYGARRSDDGQEGLVGLPFEVQLPRLSSPAAYIDVVGPQGVLRRVAPRALPSGAVVQLDGIRNPGVYVLRAGQADLGAVAVNTDPAEAELRTVTAGERDRFFREIGVPSVARVPRGGDLKTAISEMRFGVELWKYMLACALLCAVAEMFVARVARRELAEDAPAASGGTVS